MVYIKRMIQFFSLNTYRICPWEPGLPTPSNYYLGNVGEFPDLGNPDVIRQLIHSLHGGDHGPARLALQVRFTQAYSYWTFLQM